MSNIARDVIHAPFSLTRREPPKLHMQLTYHQIGEAEVKAATQAGTLDEASVQTRILYGHLIFLVEDQMHSVYSCLRCFGVVPRFVCAGQFSG